MSKIKHLFLLLYRWCFDWEVLAFEKSFSIAMGTLKLSSYYGACMNNVFGQKKETILSPYYFLIVVPTLFYTSSRQASKQHFWG